MNTSELVSWIQSQLKEGKNIPSITAELKAASHTDQQIDTALRAALSTPAPVQSERTNSLFNPHRLDATKTFVLIGSILVVLAVGIVLVSQWNAVSAFTRVVFVTFPMLAMFAVSGYLAKKPQFADVHEATLATGALIFPFAFGTTLYQFEIIPELDFLLFTVSSFAGYVLFIILEFLAHKHRFSLLTLLSFYTFLIALLAYLEVEPLAIIWTIFFASLAIALFGLTLLKQKLSNGSAYTIVGVFASALLLPSAILSSLNKDLSLPLEANAVILSIFGPLYLMGASLFQALHLRLGHKALYNLKRALEEIAPLVLISPHILAGFENITYMLIAIILSFIALFASMSVRIKSLIPVGALGLIIGILTITGKYFVDSLGWPIVIFLSGFAFIGLGYWIRTLAKQNQSRPNIGMRYGLGEDPALVAQGAHKGLGCVTVVIILFLLFAGAQFFLPIFFRGF